MCGSSPTETASAGVTTLSVRARRARRPRGRFLRRGSFQAGAGSIPDRPRTLTARAAQSSGGSYAGWRDCDSRWMTKAHVVGFRAATRVSFVPTQDARRWGRLIPGAYVLIWNDLQRCVAMPQLSGSQADSLYKQMACHVLYGVDPVFGGPSWDLEAWHENVSWFAALNLAGKCGQGWGDVVGAGGELFGHIVQSDLDTSAQKRSWLVDNQDGIYVRRHIPTTRIYFCLTNAGKPAAQPIPDGFLSQYLPEGREVTEGVCPAEPGPTPPPPQQPPSQPPPQSDPQPQPQPQPQSYRYYVYGTCADGGCGLRKRAGPGFSNYAHVGWLFDGNAVDIVCQTQGEFVQPNSGTGSNVWDRLTDGTYVTDVYVNTPGVGGAFTAPIPRC